MTSKEQYRPEPTEEDEEYDAAIARLSDEDIKGMAQGFKRLLDKTRERKAAALTPK